MPRQFDVVAHGATRELGHHGQQETGLCGLLKLMALTKTRG